MSKTIVTIDAIDNKTKEKQGTFEFNDTQLVFWDKNCSNETLRINHSTLVRMCREEAEKREE